MQVKLRLQRFGSKKKPYYRIVATTSINKRDGKFLDIVGLYHPVSRTEQVRLDTSKIQDWLNKGAQPSDTVRDLLSKAGIWKEFAEKKASRDSAKLKKASEKRKAARAAS